MHVRELAIVATIVAIVMARMRMMRLVIWSMMMVDAAGSVAGDAASMMVMTMMRLVMWIMIGPSGNALTATGRPPSPTTPRSPGARGRQGGGGKGRQAQGGPEQAKAQQAPTLTFSRGWR